MDTTRAHPVRCARCGAPITSADAAREADGHRDHTLCNPAGVLFEIRCYGEAPGCAIHGEPTAEFSWFAGYRWRYAACGRCAVHLGWWFEGADDRFFGLIRDRLAGP